MKRSNVSGKINIRETYDFTIFAATEEENKTPSLEQIIKYIKILDFQNIQQQGQDSHAAYFKASDGGTEFELKFVYETGTLYYREKDLEDWHLLA